MGVAMEVISGFVTAPAGTGAIDTVTMSTGDTLAVRNYAPGSAAYLIDLWGNPSTANVLTRVRSPRMHDNVNGIQSFLSGTSSQSVLSKFARQLLYPQDVLIWEASKLSAAAGGVLGLSMLNYYVDLPGTAARLFNWSDISGRIEHLMSNRVTLTTAGAAAGQYDAAAAINSVQDQFKANRDYAILGYTTATELNTIGIRSPDFGNLRVGGPGTFLRDDETRDFFVRTNFLIGMPTIPVFNAANKTATLVDCTDPRATLPSSVIIHCALLRG